MPHFTRHSALTSRAARLTLASLLGVLGLGLNACGSKTGAENAAGMDAGELPAQDDVATEQGTVDDNAEQSSADDMLLDDAEEGSVGGEDSADDAEQGALDGGSATDDPPTVPGSVVDGGLPGGGFVTIDPVDGGGFVVECGGVTCACADGQDNDGDGLSDGADSECLSAFDHDESSFATGVPGDNRDPKWQDCFFDGNSGAGDDGCRYHTDCLTGDLAEDDPSCQVSDSCFDYCQPLTPPGCDCFGCCEILSDSGEMLNVLVSETCSLANLDDEAACPRCEPTDLCENECGECEICLGKTLEDLPESCWPDEPPPTGSGGSGNGGAPGAGGNGNEPPGEGGAGNGGTGNGGGDNAGGGGNTEPPDTQEPPPNTCDNNSPCVTSADCGSGYCSLGCCRTIQVR